MAICRAVHDKKNPYTMINTSIAEDTRISYKAKGLWLYAFSRPDDWIFYLSDLIKRSTDGERSVYSGLNELEKYGYLKRSQLRKNGKISGQESIFYETSQIISPHRQNVDVENLDVENAELPSINPLTSIKNNNPTPSEPAPSAVVVPSCLKELDIKGSLKEKLSRKYSKSQIETACLALSQITPDNVSASIQSALQESWIPKKDPGDVLEENTQHLESLKYLDGAMIGNYSVQVSSSYVLFVHPRIDGAKNVQFKVNDKAFIFKVDSFLEKHDRI